MSGWSARWSAENMGAGRIAIAALALLVIALNSGSSESAKAVNDLAVPKGVDVSLLLIQPGNRAIDAFDVDEDGVPVFAEGSTLRVLGSSKQLVSVGGSAIDDFALMPSGAPLFITRNSVVGLTPQGLTRRVALPASGMHLRPAGAASAYVFGGSNQRDARSVYLLSRDGTLAKLATLPTPVVDVVGDGITSLVATERTVLRVSRQKPIAPVLQTRDDIVSIASGTNGGFFYATKSGVAYASSAGATYEFMRGQSGILRVRGAALFILVREGAHLVRMQPIDAFEKLLPP